MALNTKEQMNLAEAAIAVQNERKVNETPEVEMTESDAIALNFIANALGEATINESNEEEYAEAITNLVESLNQVCWSVNEYFGLNQEG